MAWKNNGRGHVTKMTAMPFKNFSEINRPMTFELSIQQCGLEPYKVCSNDDPGLTMTCFTARLKLLPNAFVWENA